MRVGDRPRYKKEVQHPPRGYETSMPPQLCSLSKEGHDRQSKAIGGPEVEVCRASGCFCCMGVFV